MNNEYTSVQNERYNSILPILGKGAAVVIANLKGRGRNSWRNVCANIQLVNNPSNEVQRQYFKQLDLEIDLDEPCYTKAQITQIVSKARFENSLPAFASRIDKSCEEEMFKLFLWEEVYEPSKEKEGKPVFLGYKPLCRLRA